MYLIKLALRPWRAAPYTQIFASLGLGFVLTVASGLYWLGEGLEPATALCRVVDALIEETAGDT